MDCPYKECRQTLKPANAATNFKNPVLSVERAVQKEIIQPQDTILEVGAGNLRNAAYLLHTMPGVSYSAFDIPECLSRFKDRYAAFQKQGLVVLEQGYDQEHNTFDVVICTFVLETICPETARLHVLGKISTVLKRTGCLVISLRGYPGVRGSRYRTCAAGEGLITPLKTFVKPYSVPEARELLERKGFSHVETLQQYRTNSPENVHLVAQFEEMKNESRLD